MAPTAPKSSKTPRSSAARPFSTTKSPLSKKKPAPNASILSFFKKVPAPEETLFIGDAQSLSTTDETEGSTSGGGDSSRYNEFDEPVKRRKLSSRDGPNPTEHPAQPETKSAAEAPKAPTAQKPRKKGPFLDDSDVEDENDQHGPDEKAPPLDKPPAAPVSRDTSIRKSLSPDPPSPNHDQGPNLIQEEQGSNEPGTVPDTDVIYNNDEDDYDDDLGEEDRERRFMEEQARIEAAEAGVLDSTDSPPDPAMGLEESGAAENCCPICDASLAGVTADQATVHVNNCLDGNPTPLPRPPSAPDKAASPPGDSGDGIDASRVSKRFARAAVARPGQANPISLGGASPVSCIKVSAFSKLMSSRAEDTAWATAAASEHASRGKQAYERTCPFYKIMPGLSICVDAFRYGAVEGCKAYFLSHFHSDHYIGLTAKWTHGPIYCSKATGSLIKSQLRTAAQYVVELDFEERFVVPDTNGVAVTMIPANHCPGSSLFLFEKTTPGRPGDRPRIQRILHCGDFRACPAHSDHALLRPRIADAVSGKIRTQKIDVCYLDTTYLNPRYSFPPQDDVIRSCAELCAALNRGLREKNDAVWADILRRRPGNPTGETLSRFFTSGDSTTSPSRANGQSTNGGDPSNALSTLVDPRSRLLVVCGTYSIGKERICKAIAQALRTRIFASPAKIRIIGQLGDPELAALMTSKPAEAQVHMQALAEIRAETLADYLAIHRAHFGRVVGFRPSGWNYRPAAAAANAAAQPSSVATTSLLHGGAWRPAYTSRHLAPQRGSTAEAMCFGVPYSEHSSFRELALFLMSLQVERVVPTVNIGSEVGRKRMKAWTDRWLAERRRGGLVTILQEDPEESDGQGQGRAHEGDEGRDAKPGKDNSSRLWDGKDGRGGGVVW
ncbi:hypothetical protein RB594_004409 [Gaeumannomyces avenae]